MAQRIVIKSTEIGLIIRGMQSPWDDPSILAQHADCILPYGYPVGFFGQGPVRTGESTGAGSSLSSGLNMHGVVFDYATMAAQRPYYVDARQAKATGVVSTVLVLTLALRGPHSLSSTGRISD